MGIFGQLGRRRLRLVQRCLQYRAGPDQSLRAHCHALLMSLLLLLLRRSHDSCEEVLDDWPKHMARYSVLFPIVENYKEVAARASVDPIIVHGNHDILLLTWMAACMSSSSWRASAAAAELLFASAGVGPAPRSAASSATTLDQPTGPAWNRFCYTNALPACHHPPSVLLRLRRASALPLWQALRLSLPNHLP